MALIFILLTAGVIVQIRRFNQPINAFDVATLLLAVCLVLYVESN